MLAASVRTYVRTYWKVSYCKLRYLDYVVNKICNMRLVRNTSKPSGTVRTVYTSYTYYARVRIKTVSFLPNLLKRLSGLDIGILPKCHRLSSDPINQIDPSKRTEPVNKDGHPSRKLLPIAFHRFESQPRRSARTG